ncbi:Ig-like domain-containing protein [Fibrobacterota bacterium]
MRVKNIFALLCGALLFLIVGLFCNKPVDPDFNEGPVGRDTTFAITETTPLKVDITASDPDNDILDWSFIQPPEYGTTEIKFGTVVKGDEFTYVSDNLISSTTDTVKIAITDFIIIDTITVMITITADNDPPYIPYHDTVKVVKGQDYGIDLLGVDPEGLPVTWEVMANPLNGILKKVRDTISDSTEATYKGDSSFDSFEYRVSDGNSNSPNATVFISNYDAVVLQEGLNGYDGCSDVSIGINENSGDFFYSNGDSLYFLHEC